ncbi:MAG: glycosyltransferase family 1 protein [bacterium]|nr:glycosyltransferase family 1 protein [bacterium]
MKIAYFTETFLPKVDGVVNTLCNLLDYLPERGHESLLFAPAGGPDRFAETRVMQMPGSPFPLYPEIKLVSPFTDVTEELYRYRPDVVHLLHPIALGFSGLRAAKALGIPVVMSYHTDLVAYARYFGFGALSQLVVRIERWIHNQADLNLCPSGPTLRELAGYGFERLKVWTRGVDTQRFSPARRDREMRMRLSGGETDKPLLLFVGRVSHEKRVHWLRSLIERVPGARLAIVGDGPARSEMEQLFAGTPTVFTGILRGEELARAYASADAFCFPSASETLGNVVLEAMASGLPVVAAGAGGPLDLIEHGRTGLLFDPNSEAAFADAVQKLVASGDFIRRAYSRAGREYAESRSWAAVHDRLLDDYARVAGLQMHKDLRIAG